MSPSSSLATKSPTPQPIHSLLLVIRTRSGPRLALYYPPELPLNHPYFARDGSVLGMESSSDYETDEASDSVSASTSEDGYSISRSAQKQMNRRRERKSKTQQHQLSRGSVVPQDGYESKNRDQSSERDYERIRDDDLEHQDRHNPNSSTLNSLPPHNVPFTPFEKYRPTTVAGGTTGIAARGVDERISRSASWTKFKSKQEHEYDKDNKQTTFTPSANNSSFTADNSLQIPGSHGTQQSSQAIYPIDSSEKERGGTKRLSDQSKAEVLAKLLAPSGRSWHKRRFELGVEDITFLGCPVFERKSGGWRSKFESDRAGTFGSANASDKTRAENDTVAHTPEPPEHKGGESTPREDDLGVQEQQHSNHQDQQAYVTNDSDHTEDKNPPSSTNNAVMQELSPRHDSAAPTPGTSFASASSLHSFAAGNGDYSPAIANATAPESLTMFHLVFVVAAPSHAPGEHQACIQTIYKHVVKPMTKALAYAQKRKNFVWNEMCLLANILTNVYQPPKNGRSEHAQDISADKTSYSEKWKSIAAKSELARAIATAYECITSGSIAHLTFGAGITQSLQIPQTVSTPFVVTPMAPQHKGIRPSTFNAMNSSSDTLMSDNAQERGVISPYSAVLLLQNVEALITEELPRAGKGNEDLLVPLTYFVRHCLPTKTLLQLSKKMSISQRQIQMLSIHLIKYRLAIAISPLHPSNTYIVSPNADFNALPEAIVEFGKRFAMLPGLVAILGKISAARNLSPIGQGPQPWITLIPSSDHKQAYMEILEWLVREGWVVQLRTFCWVRVSPEVKADVAKIMRQEAEEDEATAAEEAASLVNEEDPDLDNLSDAMDVGRKSSDSRRGSLGQNEEELVASAISPRLKAHLHPPLPNRPPSEAGSASTARTAVRISNMRSFSSKNLAGTANITSKATHEHRPSDGSAEEKSIMSEGRIRKQDKPDIHASDFEPSIIACPQRANSIESRWLTHVAHSLPQGELRVMWPRLVKHFDGKHAIEEIAMREGLKRKVVTPMLMKLIRDEEILLTMRHW